MAQRHAAIEKHARIVRPAMRDYIAHSLYDAPVERAA
jgi:hypothetical protein